MKRSMLRLSLTLLVLAAVAVPASAQYPGCEVCYSSGSGDIAGTWCGYPPDNSWGYETCGVEQIGQTWICRARGVMCYYMDVQG